MSAAAPLVLDAFAQLQPDVVLMESYPFGRRTFRRELDALVAAAQARRPRAPVLVSIREILVAKSNPARYSEIAQRVRRDIDAVLVHGDPRLVGLERAFPQPRRSRTSFATLGTSRMPERRSTARTGSTQAEARSWSPQAAARSERRSSRPRSRHGR